MAWIKVYENLPRHPKTIKLKSLMGWKMNETCGFLVRFWSLALDLADDGNSADLGVDVLAELLQMDINTISTALEHMRSDDVRFIDPDWYIHNWFKYTGEYLKGKYSKSSHKYLAIKALYEVRSRNVSDGEAETFQKRADKIRIDKNNPIGKPVLIDNPARAREAGGEADHSAAWWFGIVELKNIFKRTKIRTAAELEAYFVATKTGTARAVSKLIEVSRMPDSKVKVSRVAAAVAGLKQKNYIATWAVDQMSAARKAEENRECGAFKAAVDA